MTKPCVFDGAVVRVAMPAFPLHSSRIVAADSRRTEPKPAPSPVPDAADGATFARLALLSVGGLLVAAGLVAAWLLFVSANALKPRMESVLSEALGMSVEIRGDLRLGLAPRRITLHDVHLGDRQAEVASAERARLAISLAGWVFGDTPIRRLWLDRPTFLVERAEDGGFNFEWPARGDREQPRAKALPQLSIAKASLVYRDSSDGGFEAVDCDATVDRFTFENDADEKLLRRLSLEGEVVCSEIRQPAYTLYDLRVPITASDGIFELEPVSLRLFGGQGSAYASADLTQAEPRYRLDLELSDFRIEEYLEILAPRAAAEGSMDFSARLSSWGTVAKAIRRNATGQVSLHGEDLILYGVDLDEEISDFEATQAFNLVDVSAFLLAGPLGVMVSKGYDFAGIGGGSGERTDIPVLGSEWQVEGGRVRARDVAMTTAENRIALQGSLDLVAERYEDVEVAVVDEHGCPTVVQEIRGSFADPDVRRPDILTTLIAPIRELVERATDLFDGDGCDDVFYAGAIPPPGEDA